MPVYKYKAISKNGNKIIGQIEKENIFQVENFLDSKNYLVIEIKKINILNRDIEFNKKIYSKDLEFFCRKLFFILSSGMGLIKGLEIISNQTKNKILKFKLININEELLKGESFSNAILKQKIFPKFLSSMIKVGELSGNLELVLEELANYFEKQNTLEEELKSALIYPAIVSVAMLFLIIVAIIFIIPSFVSMFVKNKIELPLPTKILINISNFFINNYFYIICFLCLLILFIILFLKSENGILLKDKILLKINIYKKFMSYKFAKSLSILLNSGLQIINSLEIVSEVINNKKVDLIFLNITESIKKGNNFSSSIKENNIFESIISEMIEIGEETGYLEEILIKTSKYLERELEIYTKQINKIIEPIITIILGGILLFIMLAILLPIFYLTQNIL